jgi:hypothetical protein
MICWWGDIKSTGKNESCGDHEDILLKMRAKNQYFIKN